MKEFLLTYVDATIGKEVDRLVFDDSLESAINNYILKLPIIKIKQIYTGVDTYENVI